MKEEDFLEEFESIKKDVSEFKIPYPSCQYFHERARRFSKDQLDKAVELFYRIMEEKFGQKD
jgi:hypothetical protein